LRILCYHGFGDNDETLFRPKLFIRTTSFEQRLQTLRSQGFKILELEAALQAMRQGCLPDFATVITIDDGFYSTYQRASQVLAKFQFPATVYVTTYYCQHQNPICRLLVQYVFWKTAKQELDLPASLCPFSGCFPLGEAHEKDEIMWKLIDWGERECSEADRFVLAKRIAELLEVDVSEIVRDRTFHIMSADEVRSLAHKGVDIQLHTHRHRFPADENGAQEIRDNKAVLEPLLGNQLRHFCYPSGEWSDRCWPILRSEGIDSATTCERGLNYSHTPALALKRFLDSEDVSQLEFEAEIAGYMEILRRIRRWLRNSKQKKQ
jgi:peptidoglycan/xylan/chitin deacetylase (PgdA/CDA1 family)